MLHTVAVSDGEGIVPRLALALSDEEGASQVTSLEEFFLCVCSLNLTKVPSEIWEEGERGGRGRRRKGREEEGEGGGRATSFSNSSTMPGSLGALQYTSSGHALKWYW